MADENGEIGLMPMPPIRSPEQQAPVVEDDDEAEQRRESNRRGTKLLLSAAGGSAVLGYVFATGGEPGTAVLLAATVSAGINNADKLLGIAATVGEGMVAIAQDGTSAVVEKGRAVVGGVAEGGKNFAGGIARGSKEAGGGALVMTSELTGHGRKNVRELNQKRKELADLTPESYRDEVIQQFENVTVQHEQERLTTEALMRICESQASIRRKLNPDQVEAIVRDREEKLWQERQKGEGDVSMFLKLRRLMTVKGLGSAIGGAIDKTDQIIYDYGFTYSKNRVEGRTAEVQAKIDANRKAYSDKRVEAPAAYREKGKVSLGDIDFETQKGAAEIEMMVLRQEVVTDYILDMVGSHDEATIEKLKEGVDLWKVRIKEEESEARAEKKNQKKEVEVNSTDGNGQREKGENGGERRKKGKGYIEGGGKDVSPEVVADKPSEKTKTPEDVQQEKNFMMDNAGRKKPKDAKGSEGSLNTFVYRIYAGGDGVKFGEIMKMVRNEPDKAYGEIFAALEKASPEIRARVAQELEEYKKSRGGTSA